MGGVPVPLRIRLPPGGGDRASPPQLVAPEEAQEDADGREDEEKDDRKKKEPVDDPENAGELQPQPVGRSEKRRGHGRKEKKDGARKPENEPRHHPPLPEAEERTYEREETAHQGAESPVFLHATIVAGSRGEAGAQDFVTRCLDPGAVSGSPFEQSGQAAGSQAATSSQRSAR